MGRRVHLQEPELTAGQFSVTSAHVLGNTQSHIRSWAKLPVLVGLVKRCMDLSGRSATSDTMAQLGDLATRVSLVEGMILGAEAAAEPDQFGVMRPKDALLYASQVFQQAMYPALLNQIRGLMGGSLIQLPATVAELRAPGSAADIERYVRWPRAGGERVKLLKLLWDALGSSSARVIFSTRCSTRASPALSRGVNSAASIGRQRRPWLIIAWRATTPHPVARRGAS